MLMNKENLHLIRPKTKGKSDKYSINLYRYCLKYLKDKNASNIKVISPQSTYGTHDIYSFSLDIGEFKPGHVLMSPYSQPIEPGYLNGRFLHSILAGGSSNGFSYKDNFSYMRWEGINPIDVTNDFWDAYVKYGRGLFGFHSMLGDENRWIYHNDIMRECSWSGVKQVKERELYQVEQLREYWK